MTPSLFIFTALPCEAKPLIRSWSLKKHPQKHPFGIYCNNEKAVVISGIGKLAMAGAVAYALALFQGPRFPVLLNLGIAGHQNHAIGSIHLAHKVVDADTDKKFYPQRLPCIGHVTQAVKTLTKPDSSYEEAFLYDMEAAGFYEMAIKFSCLELIHCLKIISDNIRSPQENIDETLVIGWIDRHLPVIGNAIEQLTGLRQSLITPERAEVYGNLCKRRHVTASNGLKLKLLLGRLELLTGGSDQFWKYQDAKNVKDLMANLEAEIEKIDFYL